MDAFQREHEKIESEIQGSAMARALCELKSGLDGRPLVLYAVTLFTGPFWNFCKEFGLSVSCICDTYKTGVYGGEGGLQIIDLQTLARDFRDAVVVICSFNYNDEIYASLIQNGFAPESIVKYPVNAPGADVPCGCPCSEILRGFGGHLDGYRWAFNFFEDEPSRQLVLDRMRLQLVNQPVRPNTACEVYYEDGFIALSQDEVFVDGGAFNGESSEAFIRKMSGAGLKYKQIYAFEPSARNCAQAISRLSAHPRVEVAQKGLWDSEVDLPFVEDSRSMLGSSFAAGIDGAQRLQTTSLDIFFKGRPSDELPTFIKLDVEGSEKEALLGASGIIRRAKPKLAISAYHKPEDVYDLPQAILAMRGDYRYALRQHGDWPRYDETVLYAV